MMTRLLQIDTSPRIERSHSRMLANHFVTDWIVHHPESEVDRRDLAKEPIPYIDQTWITAKFTAKEQYMPQLTAAIQLSERFKILY